MMGGVGDDAQRAGAQRAGLRQQLQRLLLDVEHLAGDDQQLLARRRQHHLLALPVEQQHVVLLLKLAHLVGNRRLGEVKFLGRAGEAAADGDVVEGAKLDVSQGRVPMVIEA